MKKIISNLMKGPLTALFVAAIFALTFTLTACEDGGGKVKEGEEGGGGLQIPSELAREPEVQPVEVAPQQDITKQLQDLTDQNKADFESMKSTLQAQIDELKKQLADKAALDAKAQEEAKKQLEEYIKQKEAMEAAEKELNAADMAVAKKEEELDKALEDQKVAAEADSKKIDKLEIRLKIASSGNGGDSTLPLYVQFCKDRGNCTEKIDLPKPLDTSIATTPNAQTTKGGYAEGDILDVYLKGSGSADTQSVDTSNVDITTGDLNVIKFCVGSGNDQLYIGAVMINVDDKVWYFNPTFFRMLDKGTCTNAIRDEDVFVGFYSRTDDYDFNSWSDGTDDSIGLDFALSNCSSESIADFAKDFQEADEMNKKFYKDGMLKGRFDSDRDDFEHSDRGFYGFSAPVANCIDFSNVTLVAWGDDWWDYEPIEIYAGTVVDLINDYDNACYHVKSDNEMGDELNLELDGKGSCLDLEELGDKDYTGGMGNGDLAPPAWFSDMKAAKATTPEETGTAKPAVQPDQLNTAEKAVVSAVMAAYGIAGIAPETNELDVNSILAKLDVKIEEKKAAYQSSKDECYNKQVFELVKREQEISLTFVKATTAALKAKAHFVDMKIEVAAPTGKDGVVDNAKLDALLQNVNLESSKATDQKKLATELLVNALTEACTPEEKDAAAKAAAEPATPSGSTGSIDALPPQ